MYLIQVLSEVYFLTTTLCKADLVKFAALMERNPSVEAYRVSRRGRAFSQEQLGCAQMRKWLDPEAPWPALHHQDAAGGLALA
jgi:hypothetical protein